MGGLGLSLKKKKSEEVVSNEEPIDTTEEIPKRKVWEKKYAKEQETKLRILEINQLSLKEKVPKQQWL